MRALSCSDANRGVMVLGWERESRLLNPPPGSNGPRNAATVSLGLAIGCCSTLPPENPDTNGVRFRSEQRPAGRKRRALACSMGWEASACKTLGMPSKQHCPQSTKKSDSGETSSCKRALIRHFQARTARSPHTAMRRALLLGGRRRLRPIRRCNWETSLKALASKPQTSVSLRGLGEAGKEHLRLSRGDDAAATCLVAGFLRHELPIRLARRVVELDRLPALHEMPIQAVREWYARSALEIQEAPKPADATTERAFAKLLETIYERHAGVLYTMAHGAYELRENYEGAAFDDDASIHSFLDSFYTSRIGIRMIIGQYLALREPAHGEDAVGLLSTAVAPARIAEDAALQARHLCERQFGVAPDVKIEGRTDLDFEYVPDHAFYIPARTAQELDARVVRGEPRGPAGRARRRRRRRGERGRRPQGADEGGGRAVRPAARGPTAHDGVARARPGLLGRRGAPGAPLAGLGYGLPVAGLRAVLRWRPDHGVADATCGSATTTSRRAARGSPPFFEAPPPAAATRARGTRLGFLDRRRRRLGPAGGSTRKPGSRVSGRRHKKGVLKPPLWPPPPPPASGLCRSRCRTPPGTPPPRPSAVSAWKNRTRGSGTARGERDRRRRGGAPRPRDGAGERRPPRDSGANLISVAFRAAVEEDAALRDLAFRQARCCALADTPCPVRDAPAAPPSSPTEARRRSRWRRCAPRCRGASAGASSGRGPGRLGGRRGARARRAAPRDPRVRRRARLPRARRNVAGLWHRGLPRDGRGARAARRAARRTAGGSAEINQCRPGGIIYYSGRLDASARECLASSHEAS